MKPILSLLLLCCAPYALAEQSALDIVKRSLDLEHRNWSRAKDYTYRQHEIFREVDAAGHKKSEQLHTYDIFMLYSRPYSRLVAKDGKPLSASDEAKQEERYRRELEKRRKQSEDSGSKESRDWEKRRAQQRKFTEEIPEAYNFQLLGTANIDGKPAWMIQADPKPGFQPREPRAKMLTKIRGKLWIDQTEYQWVKIEATTTDTISFGLVLARLASGSSFRFEQRRVNNEVWLPSHMEIGMEGRLALVKKMRATLDIQYSDYRKFQTDSKVIATGEVQD